MKHTEKNEVDVLLRNLARTERARGAKISEPVSQHLDADEMNAYAEDVLPSATRNRYTAHLAECASCRKSVTLLAIASGVPVRSEAARPPTTSTIRERIAAFFSPSVIRYAIPALMLFVVLAAGMIVFRTSQKRSYIAQNREAQQAPAPGIVSDSTPQQSNGQLETKPAEPATDKSQSKQSAAKPEQHNVEQPAIASESTGDRAATISKEGRTDAVTATQPSYAPEPANAPPPPAPKAAEQEETENFVKNKREQVEEDRVRTRDEAQAAAKDDASKSKTQPERNAPLGLGVARRGISSVEDKKLRTAEKSNEGETRSVAGRRFRRADNGWIDTAYSSQSLVNVKRGSDQFRSLAADEPELKTISDSLDGTVIVVWKGHAYRIQ